MTMARPLALVTGASRGIGLELTRLFVKDGYDLVVVADSDALDSAVTELRSTGAGVIPVRTDLRTEQGVATVWEAITADGRPLAAAALNAGVGHGGAFVDTDLADTFAIIDLNVRSTVHLTKLVLDDMVSRGEGRILITSSVASTMPGPYQAVYNASKSFVQSFAEGLQGELKDSPVTITSLMPGPTDTHFFSRAELDDTKLGQGPKDDPAEVAKQGYEAMMKGERKVVAGSIMSKAMAAVNTVTPDAVKAAAHRLLAKPGSGR
ncbi:SDR family NAD(P)-dependent oxidoreductase [Rhodococcus sp. USK13]|uniref:SDR family NAD(P)-dependent oxidoreductase n=1 Tax=Rhodococcus sp. USK13 TaxID=2806442 RepID=UPI001BD083DD|nr:SDR family NAD(P)-dependent oxidoreductase [Rhodococcus sp. USK13]